MSRLYTAVQVHAADRWLLSLFGHSFAQAPEVHEYTFHTTAIQSYTHPAKKKKELGKTYNWGLGDNVVRATTSHHCNQEFY